MTSDILADPSMMDERMPRRRVDLWAAVSGAVTAIVTLTVAELASLLLGGAGNPILAVGALIVNLVPPGFRTVVIDLFDTADKLVLFISIGLLVLALALVAGILQARRPPYGLVVLCGVAAVALTAVVTRADFTPSAAVPTIAGAIAGLLTLRLMVRRLEHWRDTPRPDGPSFERRNFLGLAVALGITGAVVGAASRAVSAGASAVNDIRRALGLPAAASAAPTVPSGATLDSLDGISPWVTPNADFYRIDTALQVPSVDPADWELRVTGLVETEVTIGFDELLALPLVERYITLTCVSNDVGGDLVGNAKWLGYPIRELLARARPTDGADMVLSTSIDGFTASTPLDVLQDGGTDALLAVAMNDEPLPLEHGFPVRMVVPGLYGYVSATKWVVELRVTRFEDDLAYWSTRGWTERGPIKLSSRIDTAIPREDGAVTVAGVAWAQHIGVDRVEVRVDGGPWQQADVAESVTVDSWLQWSAVLTADAGGHEVSVRAIDRDGREQSEEYAPPAPNGSSGLHSMPVQFG